MSFNLRHFMSKRKLLPIEWASSRGIHSVEDYDKFMENGEFAHDPVIRSQLETAFKIEHDMLASMHKQPPVVAAVEETPVVTSELPAETTQDKSAKKKRQKPDTDPT